MRKIGLLLLSGFISVCAHAQYFTSDSFNTDCNTPASFPVIAGSLRWVVYNPLAATNEWGCTPNGRQDATSGDPTPGVRCSGFSGGSYQLDTSYLVTPNLYLSSSEYPDSVYLRFDGMRENNITGGRLAILYAIDSTVYLDTTPKIDLDSAHTASDAPVITPGVGDIDSGQWVTHQVNLTAYRDILFFLAFQYTSSNTSGTAWYIDNVRITGEPLGIKSINKPGSIPLSIIGQCTSSQVVLSYNTPDAGTYKFVLYDMMGRELYNTETLLRKGAGSFVIDKIHIPPGMYCVRMANERNCGIAKFIVP